MNSTIFCTFDQQDIADMAIGKLRRRVAGIKEISYIRSPSTAEARAMTGENFFSHRRISYGDAYAGPITPVIPSQPVNVKIVCDKVSNGSVTAMLVNLHAYKIIVAD